MSGCKRGLVALLILALVAWAAAPAWGQDDTGGAPARQGGKAGNRGQKNNGNRRNGGLDRGPGALVEEAVARLTTLPDETSAKVADALKAYEDKVKDKFKQAADARAALSSQLKAERDPAKKQDFRKQLKALSQPDTVADYQAAKATLKDILPAEQFASLDDLARTIMTESAGKLVYDQVDAWVTKGNVELSADQHGRIDDAVGKIKDAILKLDPGDQAGIRKAVRAVVGDIRADVLTEDQRSKLPVRPG